MRGLKPFWEEMWKCQFYTGESEERTTSLTDLDPTIVNTLHDLNGDIVSFLDLDLLYPHLNQAGILPPGSIPHFLAPRMPDNSGARNHNLVMWLQRSNPVQFREFIRLLKLSSAQNGIHARMAGELEEKYNYFLENPRPINPG